MTHIVTFFFYQQINICYEKQRAAKIEIKLLTEMKVFHRNRNILCAHCTHILHYKCTMCVFVCVPVLSPPDLHLIQENFLNESCPKKN